MAKKHHHLSECQTAIGLWVVSIMFLVLFGVVFGAFVKIKKSDKATTTDSEFLSDSDYNALQSQLDSLETRIQRLEQK